MKMLEKPCAIGKSKEITKEEAFEMLKAGKDIYCRLNSREVYENLNISNFGHFLELENSGVYEKIRFYEHE